MPTRVQKTTLIHEFQSRAHSLPERLALEDEGKRWTYRELAARVAVLEESLIAQGVVPSSYVGIYLRPSADLVAMILAILKCGAAYVPIDRSAPLERLNFITSDAKLLYVITDDPQLRDTPFLQLDSMVGPGRPRNANDTAGNPPVRPDSDAYVIYTSGSSGKPKGVICTHSNVMRLLASTENEFSFSPDDRWTLFHSVGFDFSVWEIFGALLYGGTLVVVSPEIARDTLQFAKLLIDRRITVLNQTPSAFYNLMNVAESRDIDYFSKLRVVIFGGERLQVAKLDHWFAGKDGTRPRLVNMYGITETTVHVTYREIRAEDVSTPCRLSPIGRPISDLTVHLMNPDLTPVPTGEIGEICVSGPGVARGYLNRPELMVERFVRNPLDDGANSVLYRSGDLGQRLPSGELYYLGRLDRQVKIRGYRIELGEIENVLLKAPWVSTAYVTTLDSEAGDRRLVAYVIPDVNARSRASFEGGEIPSEANSLVQELRASLIKVLPYYMIPAHLHLVPEFPLTVNGKIDERRLREMTLIRHRVPRQPVDRIESRVRQLCAEILGLEEIDSDVKSRGLGGPFVGHCDDCDAIV